MAVIRLNKEIKWKASSGSFNYILEHAMERLKDVDDLRAKLEIGLAGYNWFTYEELTQDEIQLLNKTIIEIYHSFLNKEDELMSELGRNMLVEPFQELIRLIGECFDT